MERFWPFLAFAAILFAPFVLSGCGELESGDIVTTPTDLPSNDFSQLEADAKLMQTWIDRMEPYVTQASDGSYSLDWHGFLRSIRDAHPEVIRYFAAGGQQSKDATIIEQLKDGIPAANAALKTQGSEKAASPLWHGCWWWWWGVRCCWTGDDGLYTLTLIRQAADIPPFGFLLSPLKNQAEYLQSRYGGFCATMPWIGAVWLSRP